MNAMPPTNSPIVAAFVAQTPGSAANYAAAQRLFPGGVTHDSRYVRPHPLAIARAEGARKWDVDGNEYVDYAGGHGALILGHAHPAVTARVAEQLARGTHYGANHALENRWAELIQELVPSAEMVRFTSSGTEATLMALRLARAFTGRQTVVRLRGNFHGWHDHMASGYSNHFDGTPTPGVLPGITDRTVLIDQGDIAGLRAAFASNDDIAAVIFEPTGATFGQVPLAPEFVHEARKLTTQHGALLILDEVVTGFRVSPGGAQVALGVTPDLSSFAKIVAGGLPGAAVAGRKDILDLLDFAVTAAAGQEKIQHPGTFNANPVSAAAGTAALTVIAESDATDRASATAAALRAALNEVLAKEGVNWAFYGTYSGFHLFTNPEGRKIDPARFDPTTIPAAELKANNKAISGRLRLALLVNGVDTNGRIGGVLSCTHTAQDVAETAAALSGAIAMLRQEGELARA